MTAALVSRLREMQMRQELEAADAGPAYVGSGYVMTDEAGNPLAPAWYSREFARLVKSAGLPPIRLHDARHAAATMMAAAGVEPHIRAAYLGHTEAVNQQVYTHVRPADLVAARDALESRL